MKGVIHEDARIKAIQRSGISDRDVEQERQLIIDLSAHHPLVLVHFASASLFKYLTENWKEVKQFGVVSQNETEKELEKSTEKLAEWADSAVSSFRIFLKGLKREITMTGAEYGVEIV
jgi:Rad3-related DNA helicase